MRVLIVGGSGRIGRLLPAAFRNHELRTASRPGVDLRDPDSLRRAVADFDPGAVVLAAGLADPDRCEDHPSEAYGLNVDGARNAAEAARDRIFVHFSTDHVFAGKNGPYAEDDAPGPISVYGRTKLESERIVRTVHPKALVVRTTLVFAPRGGDFFSRIVETEDPIRCWTDHIATYTYGPNLADAVAELVEAGAAGVWHLSGPEMMNRHEFALRVAERFGLDPSRFTPVPIAKAAPRAPRPLRAGLRTEKARGALRTKLLSVAESLELAYRAYGREPGTDPQARP